MTAEDWFSTKIRLACFTEPVGATRYMDSVYIFRSLDFDSAFEKALSIGKKQERSYMNAENHMVFWRLKEIVSLDIVGSEPLDGAEVYSKLGNLEQALPFDAELHPEESKPIQTI